MITVTLPAKHFFFISDFLREVQGERMFRLAAAIKNQVTENTLPDESINVRVKPDDFLLVFPILSNQVEGLYADINRQINDLFKPQVVAGIAGPDAESWAQVVACIEDQSERREAEITKRVERGRLFLLE